MSFLSARKAAGLSQAAAAKKLGIRDATVCMWETGKSQPRTEMLPKIASLYGCTIEELLLDDAKKLDGLLIVTNDADRLCTEEFTSLHRLAELFRKHSVNGQDRIVVEIYLDAAKQERGGDGAKEEV